MLKKSIAFLLLSLLLLPLPASSSEDTATQRTFDDYPLPEALSLCGEPVPLENRWVWERLDREFTIAIWDRAQIFMYLKRAGRYFPYIEQALEKAGIPQDIKYLALAESALIGYVRSRAGAKGYWQFMIRTARRSGLRKDRRVDERLSIEHSTKAAIKYLQHLHDLFGSWTLAMAAYNCGETRLRREIKEQRVKDYYRLKLPVETERYIFRIGAIKIIMENHEAYGFRIPPDRRYHPREFDAVKVRTRRRIHITDVAAALGTDYKILKELNPQVLGYYFPKGSIVLKVPRGTGKDLALVLKKLTPTGHPVSGSYYVVKPGDNLHRIAKRTGVSVSRLRDYNNIKGSLIKAGQKLQLHP